MLIPSVVQKKINYEPSHFTLALIGAAAIHTLVIFGINFGGFDEPEENKIIPRMEVTLVNTRSDNVPDKVDYLAQANQEGGGNTLDKARPETPFAPLIPKEVIDVTTPAPPQMSVPKEERATRSELMTQEFAKETVVADLMPEEKNEVKEIDVTELVSQAKAIASLEVELGESMKQYSQMPRRKFISAATKEYKYATYMESWRKKVEKTGNLNFPQEAKSRNLSGSLILDIAINTDGTIRSYKIARSSGHKILDDAALSIVHLAAPFAPLPPSIRKETDILHITRTWKFLGGDRMTAR